VTDPKSAILERRRRFFAAALASVGVVSLDGCARRPAAESIRRDEGFATTVDRVEAADRPDASTDASAETAAAADGPSGSTPEAAPPVDTGPMPCLKPFPPPPHEPPSPRACLRL
jgi:hypothetical protein